ncbi:unnamed protein product [Didymodactylos carnosus]|uniref:Peptidyl-prolyl cis-trans isomerase n=1 Tax=Didymodactylos carnosus TaxID=1234261 RepID=A0A813WR37_9BILA|nr:unnamed protein product [Didymodactylos carnosus]CAF0859898.1 unnamed protein product [Didymodactylos carnosus]CAF3642535.1 unnamed protein product [Didymodactylos carnosus]CAF3644748.1 unnamed protein product [Didymodactylos carnosus]
MSCQFEVLETGKVYYFNQLTKESVWEKPSIGKNSSKQQQGTTDKVRVLHILIKHKGSRNPTNYKKETITRSKEEARKQLERKHLYFDKFSFYIGCFVYIGIIEEIQESDDIEKTFRRIALEKSDCSSGAREGDLNYFGRKQMQQSFEEASFALAVNEMSDIVDSDSGLHIIYRIA